MRGQALVEVALLMPILLLVTAGGLILGLAMNERQQLTWAAQEAAYAAATAGAEDAACDAAIAAASASTGRSWSACDGSDGLAMDYDPPLVGIELAGSTWSPPFLDPVTVNGHAAAVIRDP